MTRRLPILLAILAPALALADDWTSLGPDGKELTWSVPASGELLRFCQCQRTRGNERLCTCTEPAATLAESVTKPFALDLQRSNGTPTKAIVPAPRLRYAGQP